MLVSLLGHVGHRLLEAADGQAGLSRARADHPDLVITDVLMPVMDGYELVRQLRLDPATAAIPVLFYTAHYGEREARELAMGAGVADVLTKPAASAEVLEIVERVLTGDAATASSRDGLPLPSEFQRDHLRLLTDKLSETAADLRQTNARLRALINIGLEFASERDPQRGLQRLCVSACDLLGATYVTLGLLDGHDRTVGRTVTCGAYGDVTWIEPGDTLAGMLATVVGERRTLRGENPGGDPAALQLPARHPIVRTYLAAPIASADHVYGWICLVDNEDRTFTADDQSLVTALSGQVGRICELDHEIAERQRVQEALRDERDRAQRYLDTADVILLALDLEGRVTLINRKGCDLLARTERELLGRDWVDTCIPPFARDMVRRRIRAIAAGNLSTVQNPILTSSGETPLIEWHNTVLRDADGRVTGTFSSGTDITERHAADEALRATEERMRFALEAANVGIWDLDYATGALRWSETLEAQHGLTPGSFGGTFDAFIACVHPDDRASVHGIMTTAMRTGADFSLTHRARWRDGSVRWLNGAGRVHLGKDGKPARGIGIFLDVTERRALEQQYQQAQKMDAVGRLASGVAHDFNNLLTVIMGNCELLLADLGPDSPGRQGVTEILEAGESAAGLTRQLLTFSRKQIVQPKLLDLNVVVTAMRTMLGRLIGENVTIVLRLGPEPALVVADRGQVEQIVMNLAVNARDAMPTGGTLTIEAANVNVGEHDAMAHRNIKPGHYVMVTVSDTGTGITPQVQARLFEPFFTTKELGKGTGLGLATVHRIMAQSHGSINVSSEVGCGATFTLYFPQADVTSMVVAEPPLAAAPRSGLRTVLVVEDADSLRELARKLLERQGYKVLVAANADEALRLSAQHASIDLLLTDVVMPGASGTELSRRLLELRPEMKVIYMSGYMDEAIVQHGLIMAGRSFLAKPFTSETLGRKLSEALES